jgi:hypothetical protein
MIGSEKKKMELVAVSEITYYHKIAVAVNKRALYLICYVITSKLRSSFVRLCKYFRVH